MSFLFSPKICGKVVLNAGAACTAGKPIFPAWKELYHLAKRSIEDQNCIRQNTTSSFSRSTSFGYHTETKHPIPHTGSGAHFSTYAVSVSESKYALGLVNSDTLLNPQHVAIEGWGGAK